LTDTKGNPLTEIEFDSRGRAVLQLLPFQYNTAHALHIFDESVLTLNLEGQLYNHQPGDIVGGEPITILDSEGEPLAIAYTNDAGKFRFTRLNPQSKYVMRLSAQTQASHVIITDSGKKIELPVLKTEVNYQRVALEDVILLVNEFNDSIQVSSKDLFVINRIYYTYNSVELTVEAKRQLNQLALIMERNAEIGLELLAHTDARGDGKYNLSLSQDRAKAAIEFLVERGVSESRFTFKGCGEAQPLNECVDGKVCSEPEYAINRRTEIRLKYNPVAGLRQR